MKKISLSLLALLLVLCIVFSVPAAGGFAAVDGTGYYVITSSNGVNIRSGPGTGNQILGAVPSNALVNVKEISGVWGKITYNGISGWVSLDYAKKTTADTNTVSYSRILTVLNTLREKFPNGKYWNHYGSPNKNLDGWTNTPCPEGHMLNGVQQCNGQCDGFARKLGLDLFGVDTKSWEERNTLDGLCVGDIIRYRSKHSIMVVGFGESDDILLVADCNWDYHCGISWDRSFSISRYIGQGPFYVLHYPGNTFTKEVFRQGVLPSVNFGITEYTISAGYSFSIPYNRDNLFTELNWRSSNEGVATVNQSGRVTAVAKGEATITVKSGMVDYASCKVTVTDHVDITRLSGNDRIDTALAIASGGWSSGASNVIIANGYSFADSLAGVPLSKALNAPILLTGNNSSGIESTLKNKLSQLKAKNVYIIGGAGVVRSSIEKSLKNSGYNVTRISGSNRFETAVKIAEKLNSINGAASKAFAVTALDYPDALSVSSVAAILGSPIIYVSKDGSVDSVTGKYISNAKIKSVDIIGGTGVIGSKVTDNLKKYGVTSTERIAGANRFATCLAVNKKYMSSFKSKTITLATGYSYPDALAGGALAAKLSAPVMLTDKGATLYNGTQSFLSSFKPTSIYVFGGTGTVSNETVYKYTDF